MSSFNNFSTGSWFLIPNINFLLITSEFGDQSALSPILVCTVLELEK